MTRHDEYRRLLVAGAVLVLVALSPSAGAGERHFDGWLHGAEGPAAGAPERQLDGWLQGAETPSARVTDGWISSLETIREGATERPSLSLASVREAGVPNPRQQASSAVATTDGWLHSNVLTEGPATVARTSTAGTGISVEAAAGFSAIALLIGSIATMLVMSRRSRQARVA